MARRRTTRKRSSLEATFGLVLRRLREERLLSQEKLGLDSGTGRTYVSQLERGEKTPSIRTIFKLSGPLRVKPSEIVRQVERLYKQPTGPHAQ